MTSGDKRAVSLIVARNLVRRAVFCAGLEAIRRP